MDDGLGEGKDVQDAPAGSRPPAETGASSGGTSGGTPRDAAAALAQLVVDDGDRAAEPRSMANHRFWSTQPVRRFEEGARWPRR